MIAAARIRLLGLPFRRRGGSVCLRCLVVPLDDVGRRSFHLSSCVSVSSRACLICPGVVIAFSLLARARIMPRCGVLCVPIVGEPRRRYASGACPRHHLIPSSRAAEAASFSALSCVCAVSSPRRSLFSSEAAIVRSVGGALPHLLRSSSFIRPCLVLI